MKNNNLIQPANATFVRHTKNVERRKNKKLRVVTLNYLPSAYRFLTEWIHKNGHEHVLAVTSPGTKSRQTPSYKEVVSLVPRNVNTIITSKMKSVLTPILPQFKPDLILCYTFAHRLAPELCQIPTYGAVNIHPSVLPLYRGPNPMRQFYDGAKFFGSTAHRMEEHYDTGEVLSQEFEELPEIVTQNTSVRWGELIKKCIDKGVENAIAGKTGIIQDDRHATYSAPFTEAERWINFEESSKVILRKTFGLNLSGGLAKASINGQTYKIHSAHYMPSGNNMPAGTVLNQGIEDFVVATADGAVKLVAELFNPNKKYANVLPYSAFIEQPKDALQLNIV